MPLLPSLSAALNNSANSLNALANKGALLDALPTDLGTSANDVVNAVESTLKAVSGLADDLSNGASINSVSAALLPVIGQLKSAAVEIIPIGKATTNELSQTLAALSTGLEQAAVEAVNPLTTMTGADLLPILNPIADDLTNVGGDLVEGLVGGTTLDNLVKNSTVVTDLVTNLGNKLSGVVTDAATIRQNLNNVVNGLSTASPTDWVNILNSTVDDTLELVKDLLSLPNPGTSVETLVSGLNGLADDISNVVSNINDGSVPTVNELNNSLKPAVNNVDALVDALLGSNGVGSAIDGVVDNSALVDDLVNDLGDKAKPVTNAVDNIAEDLLGVGNSLQDGTSPQNVVGTLKGVVGEVQNLVSDLTNSGSDSANKLIDGLQDVIGSLNGAVTDITDGSVPVASDLLGTINPIVDDLQDLSTALIKASSPGSGATGGSTGGSTGGATGGSTGSLTGGTNPNGGSTGSSTGGTSPNGSSTDNSSKPQATEGDDSLITTSNKDDFNMRGGNDKVLSTYANLQQQDVIDGGVGIDKLLITGGTTTDSLQLQVATGTNTLNLMSGVGMNGTSISNFEQFDLTGFAGSASITGANTADYIIGGGGNDQLVGVGGNDQMMGGAGNDKLLGGAGNDYLMGGVGRDRMVGGKGKDRFAFANAKDGMDIITDFNSPSDSIVISKQGFSANLGTKKLAKTQFVLGSKAQDKNDHFIYNSRSGVLSFDVDGIGGQKQIAIAKLSNHASMTAADIIFA